MKRLIKIAVLILAGALLAGCNFKKEVLFSGMTMGTTYHIKVVTGFFDRPQHLKEKIEKRLEEINMSMSTYIPNSEISRFNAAQHGESFPVSDDFMNVVSKAAKLYRLTDGAWDGTINPLINCWGFGSAGEQEMPSDDEIGNLLKKTGFRHIEISAAGELIKKNPDVTLDLASIAKGYGVDQIARLIIENGYENCLVEIGGEVFASGFKKNGQPWHVGINTPRQDAALDQVYKVVPLINRALATSGDYRNFFEMGGVRYSHVIDPRTGYPVRNGVISVSILADSCTLADGLATAVMVMGPEKGLALVDSLEEVECFIIVEQDDGSLQDYTSENFETLP